MLSRRSRLNPMLMAAVLLGAGSGMQPAFPSDRRLEPTASAAAPRRRFSSRYPWASERQLSRRFETVVGHNGHATMRRVA